MNLMQNNYFGYVYGESIDEIINEYENSWDH